MTSARVMSKPSSIARQSIAQAWPKPEKIPFGSSLEHVLPTFVAASRLWNTPASNKKRPNLPGILLTHRCRMARWHLQTVT